MKVLILAAGLGTRLGNLVYRVPKCLLRVDQTSILEEQVRILSNCGLKDITIVIGAKGSCWTQKQYSTIKSIIQKVIVNFDNTSTGQSFSLLLGLKEIQLGPIFSIDGDVIFRTDVIKKMLSADYDSFLVSKKMVNEAEPGTRLVIDFEGRITDIEKRVASTRFSIGIYGGMMKIGEASFPELRTILEHGPYADTSVEKPLKIFCKNYDLRNLEINDGWVNVNTPENIAKARLILQENREGKE